MALLGIRFLCKNLRILEACAPNRSLVLENMSTKPEGTNHKCKDIIHSTLTSLKPADNAYSNETNLVDPDKQISCHTWS